jgi:hypothetical protein
MENVKCDETKFVGKVDTGAYRVVIANSELLYYCTAVLSSISFTGSSGSANMGIFLFGLPNGFCMPSECSDPRRLALSSDVSEARSGTLEDVLLASSTLAWILARADSLFS